METGELLQMECGREGRMEGCGSGENWQTGTWIAVKMSEREMEVLRTGKMSETKRGG